MKLKTIEEHFGGAIGHTALDIAGLIPAIGEPADLANAIWYAESGEYLMATLSLISMIPEIGDIIGKGTKYISKSSKFAEKLIQKHSDKIIKYWPQVTEIIKKTKKLHPYAKLFDKIILNLQSNSHSKQTQTS